MTAMIRLTNTKLLKPGVTLSRAQVIRMLVEEKAKKLNGKLTKPISKAVNVLGERKNPERSLWRNVLIVALEDAIGKGWRDYGITRAFRAERAQAYFLEPNRDFALVCQYAGFDHEYIRNKK